MHGTQSIKLLTGNNKDMGIIILNLSQALKAYMHGFSLIRCSACASVTSRIEFFSCGSLNTIIIFMGL
uniref:Uncharacterized protein n=1 Tax=Arundo donax TaxID=35708 RepID=A0A0A9TDX5_ARUDO